MHLDKIFEGILSALPFSELSIAFFFFDSSLILLCKKLMIHFYAGFCLAAVHVFLKGHLDLELVISECTILRVLQPQISMCKSTSIVSYYKNILLMQYHRNQNESPPLETIHEELRLMFEELILEESTQMQIR
jgi:hypothetical protein